MRRAILRTAQRAQTASSPSSTRSLSTSTFSASTQAVKALRREHSPISKLSSSRTATPAAVSYSRSYSATSSQSADTVTDNAAAPEADSSGSSLATEDAGKKELDAAKKEIVELKDKYLRSVADFRNLQDRTQRDIKTAKDFAISKFARDLFDSVDNLDRALTMVPEAVVKASASGSTDDVTVNKDLLNLYDGLKMTERILMSTLKKNGLERVDPAENGDKFDPNVHEATFMAPQEGKEDGLVFATVQKGFILNGRVVRAAKVGVVKNS